MPTMQTVTAMIGTHPAPTGLDRDLLARAVDLMVACSTACTVCADACLSEDGVAEMVRCIRLDSDCADVCAAAARVMARQTAYDGDVSRAVVQACLAACRACEAECAQHAGMHEHCRVCAEACRECAEVCEELLAAMA
ncbi:four-helix bundle copper-binding protein [Aquipuribacter hungaricus]|uniref:Four-helix bundle copper-binding protein n=1 Tax=Aquipuribacter hungaricus TaxID=545624 RepID=A0ABV7WLD0_9MICO